MSRWQAAHGVALLLLLLACGKPRSSATLDASADDALGAHDAGGSRDGGGSFDAGGSRDGGGAFDAGGSRDGGGSLDARDNTADANLNAGGCVAGDIGTHAARFRWDGTEGSTANVVYEVNNLPSTSRWRAGAFSRAGVGYRSRYTDTFLAVGGLEMTSTVFMDVELSTAGLSNIRHVTVALLGRSFNTTASGGFSWQTFDGTGATANNFVANSAPYQWYRADATMAFRPGNAGVLLRIAPTQTSLVVKRVEICFDAS